MQILILSKTKYGNNHVCVGGYDLNNNNFVRLLNRGGDRNPTGWYQFKDTPLQIGDVWEIDYDISPYCKNPHTEDIFIKIRHKVKTIENLSTFIQQNNIKIWRGHIELLFDSALEWTEKNGKGYLPEFSNPMPTQSVGFWISDKDLIFNSNRYIYTYNKLGLIKVQRALSWVGLEQPISTIPAGTLIRVSLAKWWPSKEDKNNTAAYGCYLQLSGWY